MTRYNATEFRFVDGLDRYAGTFEGAVRCDGCHVMRPQSQIALNHMDGHAMFLCDVCVGQPATYAPPVQTEPVGRYLSIEETSEQATLRGMWRGIRSAAIIQLIILYAISLVWSALAGRSHIDRAINAPHPVLVQEARQ